MDFSTNHATIPVIEPANYGSTGVTSDSINTGLIQRLGLSLLFGALVGNSILKLYAGATAGAKTTALAFQYRFGSADYGTARADELGTATDVASAGLTLTAATFDHRLITIDVDGVDLPSLQPWLTVELDATATTLNVAAFGIADPRYASDTILTVL